MDTSYKLLDSNEHSRIRQLILKRGITSLERNSQAALYLAEISHENRQDVEALAYLLRALRLGAEIPQPAETISVYQRAAETTPTEILKESYDGCLALAKEFFCLKNEENGIFYLSFAADDEEADKYGVAARLLADHLSSSISQHEKQRHYEKLAARKGNPDLLPVLRGARSAAS